MVRVAFPTTVILRIDIQVSTFLVCNGLSLVVHKYGPPSNHWQYNKKEH
jgi:hypothetical protein